VSDVTASPLPLDTARGFAANRDWRGLAEWGASVADLAAQDAEVAYLYADALRHTGDAAAAARVLDEVEPRIRQSGDRHLLRRTVNLAGIVRFEAGQVAEAEQRFLELLEIASNENDDEFAARACNNLGAVANLRGQRERAIPYYTRAIAAYQRLGLVRGLAQSHHNLGISLRDAGYDADADAHFRRAIDFGGESNTEEVIALAEVERASLRVRAGDAELAAEMARRAQERFERIADPTGAAHAVRVLGLAARAAGQLDEASDRFDEALQAAVAHSDVLLRAEVQRDRGLLLRDGGDVAAAREALGDSMEHFSEIGAAAEAEAIRVLLDELEG
jgi:tetratricopeptide (TPR) repeat protein